MNKYTVIVEWDDMPFGFQSWWLRLGKRLETDRGLDISQIRQMPIGDRIVSGLGFGVEEDDYRNNETFKEMIMKFGNRNRKTPLKRYYIIDLVKEEGVVISLPSH